MALDYGRRRIGVALSDPTRTIAAPHAVIEVGKRQAAKGGASSSGARAAPRIPPDLEALVAETEPGAIVVGIPFAMDGSAGEMAQEARAFARAVEEATGVPIIEWDERLTTSRAEREIRSMDLPRSKRREKGRTDEMAAALMLSAYLRSVGPGGEVR